jgi:hypothetical protein
VVLGGLIALPWLGQSTGLPFISALFPVPKIALLPLLILWLGLGEASKVAVIARYKRIDSGGTPEDDKEKSPHDQTETNRTRHLRDSRPGKGHRVL